MDYRLPGLDGVQATRAVREALPGRRRRLPHRLGQPARASTRCSRPARSPACARTRSLDDDRRGDSRRGAAAAALMELTAENTAIVLDSTADFPDGAAALPELARRPALRALRRRELPRLRRARPDEFYERLRTAPELPTTSQPTPGDFLAAYEELARLRADPLAAHRRRSSPARSRARGSRRRSSAASGCARSTRGRASAGDRDARARRSSGGSSAARPTRRSTPRRALPARARAALHRRHARVPRPRRPDRPGARDGRAAAEHQADPRRSRTARSSRSSACAATARRSSSSPRRFDGRPRDGPALRVGIAHADAPERRGGARRDGRATPAGRRRSRSRRRSARSSARTPGPGTVGLFWFDRRRRSRVVPSTRRSVPSTMLLPDATALRELDHPRLAAPPRRRGRERLEWRRPLPGVGPALEQKLAKLGLRSGPRPARAPAAPATRRRSPERRDRRPARRGGGGDRRRGRCASRSAARARGLAIVNARVADDSGEITAVWFNQAWLAEKLQPGHARAAARAAEAERLPRPLVRPERRRRDRRLRAGLPGERGADAASGCARSSSGRCPQRATCPTRCRRAEGARAACRSAPTRSSALHRPRSLEEARGGAEAARVRRAARAPGRPRARPRRREAAVAPALGEPGELRRALPRAAAVRAHRAPGARRSREIDRDLARDAADAAAAAGRRRLGQDGRRALRAAARGRGRTARAR